MGRPGRGGHQLSPRRGAVVATVMGRAQDRGAGGSRSALVVGAFGCTSASCSSAAAGRRAVLVAPGGVAAPTEVPGAAGGVPANTGDDRLASGPSPAATASAMEPAGRAP